MARIVEHLSVAALEARTRGAQDGTEARHTQAIRLLAQGRTCLEVAEVLAFALRWVTEVMVNGGTSRSRAPWQRDSGR
jgi:hypothetical protein